MEEGATDPTEQGSYLTVALPGNHGLLQTFGEARVHLMHLLRITVQVFQLHESSVRLNSCPDEAILPYSELCLARLCPIEPHIQLLQGLEDDLKGGEKGAHELGKPTRKEMHWSTSITVRSKVT